jgi:hypothetical protein
MTHMPYDPSKWTTYLNSPVLQSTPGPGLMQVSESSMMQMMLLATAVTPKSANAIDLPCNLLVEVTEADFYLQKRSESFNDVRNAVEASESQTRQGAKGIDRRCCNLGEIKAS